MGAKVNIMKWFKLTKMFNNIPYKYGSWDLSEGLDCFTMIFRFKQQLGMDINDMLNGEFELEYNDRTINSRDYYKYVTKHEDQIKLLRKILRMKFKQVDRLSQGCICTSILYGGDVISIYIGQGKFLTNSQEYGCSIVRLNMNNIKEIYT